MSAVRFLSRLAFRQGLRPLVAASGHARTIPGLARAGQPSSWRRELTARQITSTSVRPQVAGSVASPGMRIAIIGQSMFGREVSNNISVYEHTVL